MSKSYFRKSKATRQRVVASSPKDWGADCDSCPLRGSYPVLGDGAETASIAIVGEAPASGDLDAGVPFSGRQGQYIEDKLADHGLGRRDVLLELAVACFPPGGDLKSYTAQAKKAWKGEVKEQGEAFAGGWKSPLDCCRPRLFYSLGIARCASCLRWDVDAEDSITCRCARPKWVKSAFPRIKAVLAAGNAALESLRGEGGIKAKQNYVFSNAPRSK